MSPIDFSIPTWLIIYYHFVGTVSFFLNTACIYLIVFRSDKIDNFRYFLLVFQICCTITDFHITFLMQPIPLYPVLGGFCNGFLAVYFDVWSHYLMAFIAASVVGQVGSLAICFFKKHQTIGKIMKRHVFPEKLVELAYCGAPFIPVMVFICFLQTGMRRDSQMEYINNKYPEYSLQFSQLSNFAVYELNFWAFVVAIIAFSGSLFCGTVYIFTTVDMFKFLQSAQLKRRISAVNLKRHRAALKSLVAQFVTSSLCLIPPFLYAVVIMSSIDYAQLIVQVLLAIFSLHSSVNAVVLVVTTPPYRNFVLRLFDSVYFFKKKKKHPSFQKTTETKFDHSSDIC
ncbi:hypothetical protein CAEBREN_04886 [Caenorhabditis brenneri]|uniref:Uncharacterized protein n=1 Tax=Caenorhabditis brenneri TaxID=135651 RepID=G0NL40_CAEBE|nr:hypothetical protein CAEBREN_04886 [Caenorhabditis brenneri]